MTEASSSPKFKTKCIPAAILAALLLTLATLILLLAAQGYESSFQASLLLSTLPQQHDGGTLILKLLSKNGTSPCHHARTHGAIALGLPAEFDGGGGGGILKPLPLQTGHPFTFQLASVTENGTRRCAGGDFYETQLQGTHWMSRPLVVDMDDGTYSITISVDESFPGMYEFKAVLLFDNMHGLDFDPRKWGIQKEVLNMRVEMTDAAPPKMQPEVDVTLRVESEEKKENSTVVPEIRQCVDAGLGGGGGRWTRSWYNRTCEADDEGRYKWCTDEKNVGKAALLESNGWIYSKSSCSFKIWEAEEAWQCLQGRWLLFWGDSNLQDTISNLLFYILGFPKRPQTGRMSHKVYTNPHNSSQSLLISLFFNGHHVPSKNGLGLSSLYNSSYRLRLQEFYRTGRTDGSGPDAIILTTGPHDADYFPTIANFSIAVDYAGDFWRRLLIHEGGSMNISHHEQIHPLVVLRTAVAPAGELRAKAKQGNPQKMEAFNAIMVERFPRHLEREGVVVQVLDTYDATFPFHFDHNYSDGFHYGREPKSQLRPWFGRPHHYFVDIMSDHMLLNVLCSHFPPPHPKAN